MHANRLIRVIHFYVNIIPGVDEELLKDIGLASPKVNCSSSHNTPVSLTKGFIKFFFFNFNDSVALKYLLATNNYD